MTAVVSAVVVTYDSGESLAEFVASLGLASAHEIGLVVVDNGSTDGAPQRMVSQHGVSLVVNPTNLGYGAAANIGVRATDSDWVLIANPDVVFAADAVDRLLAVADRWPRAGAIGPLIRDADGTVYPSARQLPSLVRGAGHAVFGWWWPSNPWTAAYRQDRLEPVEREAGWLSGSCLLVRREAFDSVGGFDDGYFMYFEDVDLGERLGRSGWLNVYAPSAAVVHAGAHSTKRHAEAMLIEHHRSAYRYLSSHYQGRAWAPLRFGLRGALTARVQVARMRERSRSDAVDPNHE